MGLHPAQALTAALALLAAPAAAQEAGWHYSPLPGEGDRATLGCARDSTPQNYACIAVRCEDDFTTGVHIHTSRPTGDVGRWAITVDKETRSFDAEAAQPYGARLVGDFPGSSIIWPMAPSPISSRRMDWACRPITLRSMAPSTPSMPLSPSVRRGFTSNRTRLRAFRHT